MNITSYYYIKILIKNICQLLTKEKAGKKTSTDFFVETSLTIAVELPWQQGPVPCIPSHQDQQ